LNWCLSALGDRLEKPGQERLSVSGTLSRADSQAEEVNALLEFPDRLRLTRQKGNQARVIAFDGDQVKRQVRFRQQLSQKEPRLRRLGPNPIRKQPLL
jgi:hypothetical protein